MAIKPRLRLNSISTLAGFVALDSYVHAKLHVAASAAAVAAVLAVVSMVNVIRWGPTTYGRYLRTTVFFAQVYRTYIRVGSLLLFFKKVRPSSMPATREATAVHVGKKNKIY